MNTKVVITIIVLGLILSCQQGEVSRQAEERTNKVLEIWNNGNIDLIDEICAPEYVRRYVQIYEDIVGIDAYKEWVTTTRTTFPDFTVTIDEQINTADWVIYRWTVNATNTGPGNFPPTGNRITFSGASIAKIVDGKAVEEWLYFNQASVLTQLGFTINPPVAE